MNYILTTFRIISLILIIFCFIILGSCSNDDLEEAPPIYSILGHWKYVSDDSTYPGYNRNFMLSFADNGVLSFCAVVLCVSVECEADDHEPHKKIENVNYIFEDGVLNIPGSLFNIKFEGLDKFYLTPTDNSYIDEYFRLSDLEFNQILAMVD